MLKLKALYTVCFQGIILDVFDDTVGTMWPGKMSAGMCCQNFLLLQKVFFM